MAGADVEPNDGITQVEGPLSGGTTYSGTLSTENDHDWYAFYAASQTQLDVTLTTPGTNSCSPRYWLMDTDGEEIDMAQPSQNGTAHFRHTTAPGTNRYLLAITRGCAGDGYQFSLAPAGSIVSGPRDGTPAPTPEPNESSSQAFGPLLGGRLYGGAIQTENDVDSFFFYTSGGQQFDLAVAGVKGCAIETVVSGPGAEGLQADASADTIAHIRHSPSGPARYDLSIDSDCSGSVYEFRIDPPSALSRSLPAAPAPVAQPPRGGTSSRCSSARKSVKKWTKKVRSTKKAMRRTKSRAKRRKLRKRLGAQKRALRRARDRAILHC